MTPSAIMTSRYRTAAMALAAAAITGLSFGTAEAKMPNIKRASEAVISFDLAPPVEDVGSTADGTATIEISESRKSSSTELEVNVTGLTEGTYSVVATLEQLDPAVPAPTEELGQFTIAPVTPPPVVDPTAPVDAGTETEVVDEAEFEKSLTSALFARNITQLTISKVVTGAEPDVVLVGEPTTATEYLKFFANVRVTAPTASSLTETPSPDDDVDGKGKGKGKGNGGKPKKVHGHALAKATIIDGAEKNRFFLFVAQGAPADTLLDIVVDGVKVGEVTSTKSGKVMFKSIDETVQFEEMDLLTIVDPATEEGTVVMQADFSNE